MVASSCAVQAVALQAILVKLEGLGELATFPTIMARAPAAFAFRALSAKVHVPPRLTKAILPATAEPITEQPSAGEAATMSPVTVNACVPKTAVPTPYCPASADGESMVSAWKVIASKRYICMRGRLPSDGVDMFALLRPVVLRLGANRVAAGAATPEVVGL